MIAPNSIASRKTIDPVMATMRRTPRGYARACPIGAAAGVLLPRPCPRARTKKMHRIGGASVQLTRSTFPKRLPGGESLRPSALRARCTRKSRRGILSVKQRTSHNCRKFRQSCIGDPDSAEVRRLEPYSNEKMHRGPVLRRPAPRLTAAEATACRRAINLGRSVLGAPGTLGLETASSSGSESIFPLFANFSLQPDALRRASCALHGWDQGFAEPGALSSTSPADLPLPRTASRESFVLVASRARRSGNLRSWRPPCKGICRRKGRKLRTSR